MASSDKVFTTPGNDLTSILAGFARKEAETLVPADASESEKATAKEQRLVVVKKASEMTDQALKIVLGKAETGKQQVELVQQMRKELIETGINKLRRGQFVLIVDGTSSMQPFMDNLKLIVVDLIRTTFIKLFRQGFSIHICVYRDSPIKTVNSTVFVFDGLDSNTNATNANEALLDTINVWMDRHFVAKGGADIPEWLNSGLTEGLNYSKWDEHAGTKMVFVMTDAPKHGLPNHGLDQIDSYPDGLTSDGNDDHGQQEIRELLRIFSADKSMYFSFFKLLPMPGDSFDASDRMLSTMYDNWLSIMKEIDPKAIPRFSSYQINSSTSKAPQVLQVIKDSILKTTTDSITMSQQRKNKKDVLKLNEEKLTKLLKVLAPVPEDEDEDDESDGGGGNLRNIMKRSYKRSNKNSLRKKFKKFISRK